ncbi:MAG: GerMN domain-containing protein [Firmicutes bacterium]|nr:GerMN domain-containing protein [Bacillota bacterium]
MKKLLALALVIVLALGFSACGKQKTLELTSVTIYLPDQVAIDAGGYGFAARQVEMHMPNLVSLQAMQLVSHLAASGALPEGCAVLSFDEENATLDMNEAFAQALGRAGTLGETLLLGCLVNTMLDFFGLQSITVTAQGEVLQTGHETYSDPLGFYGN